jgi:hypothetical protein
VVEFGGRRVISTARCPYLHPPRAAGRSGAPAMGALGEPMDAAHAAHITERGLGAVWATGKVSDLQPTPMSN